MPDQFVTAVENALGHHLQLVLTDQPSSAQEILAELSANKSGRASIAALSIQQYQDEKQLSFVGEMAPGEKSDAAQAGLRTGQIVHAMSVISAEPSVEALLKSPVGPHVHRRRSYDRHDADPERPRRLRLCHAGRRTFEPARDLHRRLFEQRRERQSAQFNSWPEKPDH